jgi:DNA polymerase III delta prime subunit
MIQNEYLWTEIYRPHKIADTILPSNLKKTFQTFVDSKNVPNLILSGTAGVGKTTVAKAMLDEIGADYIVINGSEEGRLIDTLRVKIKGFASSVSFTGGRKYVIIDEADYMNAESVQPALRSFMEEFSKNCGFILTCNFINKIIEPLHSRCSVIDFRLTKEDKPKMAAQFFKRVCSILDKEKVEHEPKVVAEFISKHFPDNRRVLNELQRYSAMGKIDTGILANVSDANMADLMKFLKEKDFGNVRKWVAANGDGDAQVFRKIYDSSFNYVVPSSVPQVVLTIAKYQYQAAFVADHEINLVACLTELMVDCEWK